MQFDNSRFGTTNLGKVGMETFFLGHKCNSVCAQMKLKPNKYMAHEEYFMDMTSVSAYWDYSSMCKEVGWDDTVYLKSVTNMFGFE